MNYTYYDGRTLIQREYMRKIEGTLNEFAGGLVEVAKFPSGHKVWRVAIAGCEAAVEIETEDHGLISIEPTNDYTLEHMLTDWETVT